VVEKLLNYEISINPQSVAWTQTDLDNLEKAIRTGARKVKHGDEEIEFRSLREMQSLRREMRKSLGIADGRTSRRTAVASKGL
jgi:hypothetical protein